MGISGPFSVGIPGRVWTGGDIERPISVDISGPVSVGIPGPVSVGIPGPVTVSIPEPVSRAVLEPVFQLLLRTIHRRRANYYAEQRKSHNCDKKNTVEVQCVCDVCYCVIHTHICRMSVNFLEWKSS